MRAQQRLLKAYFGSLSFVAPKIAAKKGFDLFQQVRKKDIRNREEDFYEKARRFDIKAELDKGKIEQINCYTLGEPKNPLVILVHGWDSNAGSMSQIAFELVAQGKSVLLFNLPGHAFYERSATNLLECRRAFSAVLEAVNPKQPFSVISHSFGSAVTAYALSKHDFQIDKLVFLTNPNKVERIFDDFKNFIGLGDRAYDNLLKLTREKLGEPIESVSVAANLTRINYNQLLLIHDKNDKVLSYYNSLEVKDANPKATLSTYENIGHYKMLWNKQVIADCIRFVN